MRACCRSTLDRTNKIRLQVNKFLTLKLRDLTVASGSNAFDNISDSKSTLHRYYRIFYKLSHNKTDALRKLKLLSSHCHLLRPGIPRVL